MRKKLRERERGTRPNAEEGKVVKTFCLWLAAFLDEDGEKKYKVEVNDVEMLLPSTAVQQIRKRFELLSFCCKINICCCKPRGEVTH